MKLRGTTIVCIAALAVTLVLAVVGWFLLPESVGMQFGLSGRLQNYLPKPLALALPTALCALGAGLSANEARRNTGLILSLVSPALVIFTLFMNL